MPDRRTGERNASKGGKPKQAARKTAARPASSAAPATRSKQDGLRRDDLQARNVVAEPPAAQNEQGGLRRDEAATTIRRLILAGEPGFQSGAILSETRVADRLKLTRTPIRQALSQLAGEGLVSIIPQVGTQVCIIGAEEIEPILATRFTMESLVVVELAKRRPDLSDLWKIHQRMKDIARSMKDIARPRAGDSDGRREFSEGDMRLHARMAELVPGYERLSRTVNDLVSRFLLFAQRGIQTPDWRNQMQDIVDEHEAILDAVSSGNPDEARARLQDHIRKSAQRLARFALPYIDDLPRNLGFQPLKGGKDSAN